MSKFLEFGKLLATIGSFFIVAWAAMINASITVMSNQLSLYQLSVQLNVSNFSSPTTQNEMSNIVGLRGGLGNITANNGIWLWGLGVIFIIAALGLGILGLILDYKGDKK